jgi:hypothetical protein
MTVNGSQLCKTVYRLYHTYINLTTTPQRRCGMASNGKFVFVRVL